LASTQYPAVIASDLIVLQRMCLMARFDFEGGLHGYLDCGARMLCQW